MSNKHFNNNKKAFAGHEFQLSPGEYNDVLVNDFFCFTEGKYDEMKVLKVDERKSVINDVNQMAKVLHAGDTAWKRYCDWYNLPRECRKLFVNKVKKQWHIIGKEQNQEKVREDTRN